MGRRRGHASEDGPFDSTLAELQLGMFSRDAEMRRAWTDHLAALPEVERDRLADAGELEVPTVGSERLPPGWRWGPDGAWRGVKVGQVGAVYGERLPIGRESQLMRRAGLRPRVAGDLEAWGVGCACIIDALWHRPPPRATVVLVRRWDGPGQVSGGLVWFRATAWETAPLVELGEDLAGLRAFHAVDRPHRARGGQGGMWPDLRGRNAYPWTNPGNPLKGGWLETLDASSANRRPRSGP